MQERRKEDRRKNERAVAITAQLVVQRALAWRHAHQGLNADNVAGRIHATRELAEAVDSHELALSLDEEGALRDMAEEQHRAMQGQLDREAWKAERGAVDVVAGLLWAGVLTVVVGGQVLGPFWRWWAALAALGMLAVLAGRRVDV